MRQYATAYMSSGVSQYNVISTMCVYVELYMKNE